MLSLAETAFDVFVTIDTNLGYQQNITGRTLSIVILRGPSNSLDILRKLFPALVSVLEQIKPGEITFLDGPAE